MPRRDSFVSDFEVALKIMIIAELFLIMTTSPVSSGELIVVIMQKNDNSQSFLLNCFKYSPSFENFTCL